MPVRVVIEADTPIELRQAIEQLVWGNAHGQQERTETQAGRISWREFVDSRSENQKKILHAFERHNGQINLRELENEVNLSGPSMAGTLASLQRGSRSTFGVAVLLLQTWFKQPNGAWDRTYILNSAIYDEAAARDGEQHN